MELTAKQQITELIKNSQKVLITTHFNPDGDALGSALALYLALKKLGKDPVILSANEPAKAFQFLPSITEVKKGNFASRDFVISVNTSIIKIDKLGYKKDPQNNLLNITLTPSSGKISKDMISFSEGNAQFDLIIVLDSSDLERLGSIYDENTDLFYEVPVINIDHHPGNDHFGKVNWVDMTATSTSEILVSLLESLGREKSLFDPDVATCLLTGLITDTGSFQHSNTTPKSFTVAAQLIAAGARQQEIIKHIFKTKPLTTLKIWGKVLTNINEEREDKFVWSAITSNDFEETFATEDELSGVTDELLKTVPNIDFALLISERHDGVYGSLRGVQKGVNVADIAKIFGGGGHELAAAFRIYNSKLADVKDEIISKIKNYQRNKSNPGINNPIENYNNNIDNKINIDNVSERIHNAVKDTVKDQHIDNTNKPPKNILEMPPMD